LQQFVDLYPATLGAYLCDVDNIYRHGRIGRGPFGAPGTYQLHFIQGYAFGKRHIDRCPVVDGLFQGGISYITEYQAGSVRHHNSIIAVEIRGRSIGGAFFNNIHPHERKAGVVLNGSAYLHLRKKYNRAQQQQ